MKQIELRKKASVALIAIIFFIIFYLFLIAAALAFTILCGYGGITLIALKPSLITLALGIGLIGLGCLVSFFLLKFIFKKQKTDLSGLVEIHEKDEPKLFALIKELSKEIKTDFPKRIYLSSDINASVFYDSGFWSMFLPIRKNLLIGLGLVNSVTESELKAILAHEFGHFSQKSMKIGSYVYNVNKVIYNLLYENESYNSFIVQWANITAYFAIFARIGIKIIEAIQWMLQQAYKVVNLSYMQLSREMEFHADEVAASVAGSKPLIDSLMRMEFAENAYSNVLNFYNGKISENKKTANIYPQHSEVMKILAESSKLEMSNGLPQVSKEFINKFKTSLVVIKDQWASHPTTEERVERLEDLGYKSNLSTLSAWNYFSLKEKWQMYLTDQLFKTVSYKESPSNIDLSEFKSVYYNQVNQYSIDPVYNGFYDNKDISVFEIEEVLKGDQSEDSFTLNDIFHENAQALLRREAGLNNDIYLLEQISTGIIKVNSFDFDGRKYKPKNAPNLLAQLKKDKELLEKDIKAIDIQAFTFFYRIAKQKGLDNSLKEKYLEYFKFQKEYSKDVDLYVELTNDLQFVNYTTPFHEIRKNFNKIKIKEGQLKNRLSVLFSQSGENKELYEENKKDLNQYLSSDLLYFNEPTYYDENLRLLFSAINSLYILSSERFFKVKKKLLSDQLDLIR